MALRPVQVDTKAGVHLQDLRDNRCHHHNGVLTMAGLHSNRDMALMVRCDTAHYVHGPVSYLTVMDSAANTS